MLSFNNCNTLESIKWYAFYNNKNRTPDKVLQKSCTINTNGLIVARKIGKGPGDWMFTKFSTLDHFMHIFENTHVKNRKLYAVLTDDIRYLYLDVDYKLNQPITSFQKNELITIIKYALSLFIESEGYRYGIKNNAQNWLIWDASRNNKFSIHLINKDVTMIYWSIEAFVGQFRNFVKNCSKLKLNKGCTFDTNIYH